MDILIGSKVKDKDGALCTVTNTTSNSIEVLIPAKTEAGITASNWFTEKNFNDRFTMLNYE